MLSLNEVHEGDCLELMPFIPDGSVDMILADLPYGTTACKWDTVIPLEPLWEQYKRVIKPNGAIVLTASQPFTSVLVTSNPKWFRCEWIWDKRRCTGGAHAHKAPMKAHESILVFARTVPIYNPQKRGWTPDEIKRMNRSDFFIEPKSSMQHAPNVSPSRATKIKNGRNPDTVIRIGALGAVDSERVGHPTQKPVTLFEYLIKTYTNEGETVLDNTAGSCTTAVAAIRTNRNFICIEREFEYVQIGRNRIKAELEQPRLLEVVNVPA